MFNNAKYPKYLKYVSYVSNARHVKHVSFDFKSKNSLIKKIAILSLIIIVLMISISSVHGLDISLSPNEYSNINQALSQISDEKNKDNSLTLNPGVYNRSSDLNSQLDLGESNNLVIQGEGSPENVIIDANGNGNILNVKSVGNLTFINVSFINTLSADGSPAINFNFSQAFTNGNTISFINCIFDNNENPTGEGSSGVASAIAFTDAYNHNYNLNLINSTFKNNKGVDYIIYHNHGVDINDNSIGKLTIINSTFINNNGRSGIIRSTSNGITEISNSTFINNSVSYFGIIGAVISNINSSIFINNTGGEALFFTERRINVDHSIIYNNSKPLISCGSLMRSTENYRDNITLDHNWWGDNNPDFKGMDVLVNNYYTSFINTTAKNNSLQIGDNLPVYYFLVLNGTTDTANSNLLPYFEIVLKASTGYSKVIDGRFNNVYYFPIASKTILVNSYYSNNLSKVLSSIYITETKKDSNSTKNDERNHNNSDKGLIIANAGMKETGIPLIAIFLILLSLISILFKKK